jgi:hypothetical protein
MPTKRLIYEEPLPVSREQVDRALSSGTSEEIERTLVAIAFHEADFDFALATILTSAVSADPAIRGTAILCLGHLARIHGRLPADRVVDVVRTGLVDSNEYVRGQAETAADDIEQFVPSLRRGIRQD